MRMLAMLSAAFLFFFLAVSVPVFAQEQTDHPQTKDENKNGDKVKSKEDEKAPKNDNKAVKQDDRGVKDDRGMKQDEGKRDETRPENGKNPPERSGASQPEQAPRPDKHQRDHANDDRQQRPVAAQRGQHIPDDKFRSHFGREHHFHVDRARIVNESQPVVVYGGYSFELVDTWPAEWSYDDDCYIDYVDDGYYLFDVLHPGIRIAVIVME